jgi:hypothetical protein
VGQGTEKLRIGVEKQKGKEEDWHFFMPGGDVAFWSM